MRDNVFETHAHFARLEETFDVRRICRYLPLLVVLLASIQLAGAQSLIDINMGFGSAQDKATGNGIEGDYTNGYLSPPTTGSPVFGASCALAGTTVTGLPACYDGGKTNALGGVFMGLGANLMLWEHFGIGMEVAFNPNKPTYASIPAESPLTSAGVTVSGSGQTPISFQERTTFYDFNGIYQPWKTEKAELQLIGGFGGANTKTYVNQSSSGSLLGGSSSSSQYAGSSNHLNLHAGVAVQIYLTDHMYIRPQFDFHYVPGLQQYGSKMVMQEMVWIGYTIGDRK